MLAIVKEPNKLLRKKAERVALNAISSKEMRALILQMKETLSKTPDGVGLAAPQVGKSLQIFIVSGEAEEIDKAEKIAVEKRIAVEKPDSATKSGKSWHYHVFINPLVKNTSKRKLDRTEGCLSVPGKFGSVKRYEKITVEAYNEKGEKFTRGSAGFFARVVQHELDHLKGELFIDHAAKVFDIEFDKKA